MNLIFLFSYGKDHDLHKLQKSQPLAIISVHLSCRFGIMKSTLMVNSELEPSILAQNNIQKPPGGPGGLHPGFHILSLLSSHCSFRGPLSAARFSFYIKTSMNYSDAYETKVVLASSVSFLPLFLDFS